MQRVQQAQAAVLNQKLITAPVKSKMERLRASCDYRNTADTVPTADSLVPSPSMSDTQRVSRAQPPAPWNVLAEDYWDLYNLLLR